MQLNAKYAVVIIIFSTGTTHKVYIMAQGWRCGETNVSQRAAFAAYATEEINRLTRRRRPSEPRNFLP